MARTCFSTVDSVIQSACPIPAFERTLAEVLDEPSYERIQSFFDGEHDAVYGMDAGERAHTQLRDALEIEMETGFRKKRREADSPRKGPQREAAIR